MNYIHSSEIIDTVQNELDTLFNQNSTLLDDTILNPVIAKSLAKLKLNHYPQKWCIIKVDKCKGKLPSDFHRMCVALMCVTTEYCSAGRFGECIHTEEQKLCKFGKCESECDYDEQCGDYYRVIEKRTGGYLQRSRRYALLCPSKSSYSQCDKNCFNFKSKSEHEIDIKDGYIQTNFDTGVVYMDYLSTFEDSDGYLIPDNSRIIEWIEKELIYKVFTVLYYNGEGDYARRYQTAKFDADIAYRNAMSIIKLSEVNEYYKLAREMQRRYNCLNLWNCTYLQPGINQSNSSLQRYNKSARY